MSIQTYNLGGLRTWNEQEINYRNHVIESLNFVVQKTLKNLNNAWAFYRIEGPTLIPSNYISQSYTADDIFNTNHDQLCLRAETTFSSYEFARSLNKKLPFCIWQSGKSYRRELSDGATASKLRYNEFYQLEFQCIYSDTTKVDYRHHLINGVSEELKRLLINSDVRVVDSDRLPLYSISTKDIEVYRYNQNSDSYTWTEVVSCSIRNDFNPNTYVCEIAIGLDRVVDIALNINKQDFYN